MRRGIRRYSILAPSLFALVLLGGLPACSSSTKSAKRTDLDPVALLEEQVKTQSERIEFLEKKMMKLAGSVAASEILAPAKIKKPVAVVAPAPAPTPKEQVDPPTEAVTQIPSLFATPGEDTIADSSQEGLHDYYEGLEALKDRKYDLGLKAMQRFLAGNPSHVYADRAQYLIADSHFRSGEFGLAIVAINVLEVRYPHSVRLPEALFDKGMAYLKMDQKSGARNAFMKLMKTFPMDPLAKQASQRLASLSSDAQKPVTQ